MFYRVPNWYLISERKKEHGPFKGRYIVAYAGYEDGFLVKHMEFAYGHPDGSWSYDLERTKPLDFTPIWVATAPFTPPLPPPELPVRDNPTEAIQDCFKTGTGVYQTRNPDRNLGCFPGCYYYGDSCYRTDCDGRNKVKPSGT